MPKFLAVFTGAPGAFEAFRRRFVDQKSLDDALRAGMSAWGDWVRRNEQSIVDLGGPLGKTKRIASDGIRDISNALSGYVIVQAESHEAAAKLFEGHPHFTAFPGEAVEIMPCLPIPTPPA